MPAAMAAGWGSMIILFRYFTVLSRLKLLGAMIEQSSFGVKLWDSCKNCNVERNRTKPLYFGPDRRKRTKDFPGVKTP